MGKTNSDIEIPAGTHTLFFNGPFNVIIKHLWQQCDGGRIFYSSAKM